LYREQFTGLTAFVDASNVYGSTCEMARMLRKFVKGYLRMSPEQMVPYANGDPSDLQAGDERARENPMLASLHALFLREHNRLAGQFSSLFPEATDEEIYQKARRLVWAQMQNIVYGQYLNVLLGAETMKKYRLEFDLNDEYEEDVNPGIKNSFAAAAFRFGHSGLQGQIEMKNPYFDEPMVFSLRDHFFNLRLYYERNGKGMEDILNGMMYQAGKPVDRFVTKDVTRFLFANVNGLGSRFGGEKHSKGQRSWHSRLQCVQAIL